MNSTLPEFDEVVHCLDLELYNANEISFIPLIKVGHLQSMLILSRAGLFR